MLSIFKMIFFKPSYPFVKFRFVALLISAAVQLLILSRSGSLLPGALYPLGFEINAISSYFCS